MVRTPRFSPTQAAQFKAQRMDLDLRQGTHGTVMPRDGSPMGDIVPSNKSGRMVHSTMSDPTRAYYTARDTAFPDNPGRGADRDGWKWARLAADHGSVAHPRGRAIVHNVRPVGKVDVDENLPSTGAMTANRLRVTDTQWIPPGTGMSGDNDVQGTLWHVNWNEFRGPDNRDEANWHAYGKDPKVTASERIRQRAEAPTPAPQRQEIPGQMEMVDRPSTWYQEARKADI